MQVYLYSIPVYAVCNDNYSGNSIWIYDIDRPVILIIGSVYCMPRVCCEKQIIRLFAYRRNAQCPDFIFCGNAECCACQAVWGFRFICMDNCRIGAEHYRNLIVPGKYLYTNKIAKQKIQKYDWWKGCLTILICSIVVRCLFRKISPLISDDHKLIYSIIIIMIVGIMFQIVNWMMVFRFVAEKTKGKS